MLFVFPRSVGMWLSWLACFAHIEEVGGSSPFIPTMASVLTAFEKL